MSNNATGHDFRYELRAVALLTFAFGLVGIDRFAMNYMFPAMREDLGLSYQDLGNASGMLSLALGISALIAGPLTDRFGARAVVVPSVVVFSLSAGLSGLVDGMGQLLVLRFTMGLADGAFATACITASLNAAAPSRKALVNGISNAGLSILGLGLGPILITWLLATTGSWRLCFFIITIPGLILAVVLWRTLRDKSSEPTSVSAEETGHAVKASNIMEVLRYRNVWICMGLQTTVVGALVTVVTMTPSYIVDTLKMPEQVMGTISSAIGFGTVTGALVITAISDRVGRQPVILGCAIGALLMVCALYVTGPNAVLLFIELALISALCFASLYIVVGPAVTECVPPSMGASATGFVIATSEILGGAVAPTMGGYVAEHYGLAQTYLISIGALCCAIVLALFLRTGRRPAPMHMPNAAPQVL
tara:strand:- start:120318 stop:121580 length:1263 start_codon:yes stop_codon:yes gene_type:complete